MPWCKLENGCGDRKTRKNGETQGKRKGRGSNKVSPQSPQSLNMSCDTVDDSPTYLSVTMELTRVCGNCQAVGKNKPLIQAKGWHSHINASRRRALANLWRPCRLHSALNRQPSLVPEGQVGYTPSPPSRGLTGFGSGTSRRSLCPRCSTTMRVGFPRSRSDKLR